jgi:hypothetical protein
MSKPKLAIVIGSLRPNRFAAHAAEWIKRATQSGRFDVQVVEANPKEDAVTNPAKTPIAIITGGSRGLGRSMAMHLAARGVDIILMYRASASEASEARERIRALGRKAVALPLDVADTGKFASFARSIAEELQRTWGRKQFDYLVNNAGIAMHAGVFETT